MYYFGKTKSKKKSVGAGSLLPAPEVAGATEFGRYLRYGRRSLFGRRYFGFGEHCGMKQPMGFGNHMPALYFGKGAGRKKKIAAVEEEPSVASEFGRRYNFGRRRKSTRKGKKPTKALIRMCKRYRIKVTRKVGKKKVYKSITVLKRLCKKKKKNLKKKKVRKTRKTRKTRKVRKTRRTRRRNRFSLFGLKF